MTTRATNYNFKFKVGDVIVDTERGRLWTVVKRSKSRGYTVLEDPTKPHNTDVISTDWAERACLVWPKYRQSKYRTTYKQVGSL